MEQFDKMRGFFLNKIDILNSEVHDIKISTRKQIHYIEDELKQEKHVKELFLRQINELQRLIDNKL